jgi:hypothetical protein
MGLVQNPISLEKLILFTSSFFSLKGMTLGYLKIGFEIKHGPADYF